MKKSVKIYLFLTAIGLIICVLKYDTFFDFITDTKKAHLEYYYEKKISGEVINKLIDKQDYDSKKIVIKEVGNENSFIFDFEITDLFNFIKIGDTVIKKSNSLKINLKREKLDTILVMKIYNDIN